LWFFSLDMVGGPQRARSCVRSGAPPDLAEKVKKRNAQIFRECQKLRLSSSSPGLTYIFRRPRAPDLLHGRKQAVDRSSPACALALLEDPGSRRRAERELEVV